MTAVYVCAYQGGQPSYHDSERAAESAARELVASKKTSQAVVYRMDTIEGEQ